MAVGPIPWTSMVEWSRFNGLDDDAARILIHVLRTLDIEHAEAQRADAERREALKPAGRARRR
jgi:hypothetical protein